MSSQKRDVSPTRRGDDPQALLRAVVDPRAGKRTSGSTLGAGRLVQERGGNGRELLAKTIVESPLECINCKRTQAELADTEDRLRRADDERLRLLRRLVAVHEDERRSVAEAIHDDSIQAVAALAIRVSALRRTATDEALRTKLSEIEVSVADAVSRLRRLMFELHPTTLDHSGLALTVEAYLDHLSGDDPVTYGLENELEGEPSHRTRLALYRIIQEAITNARKHARARRITVQLKEDAGGGFVARIRDDGAGFIVGEIESPAGHLGMSKMREHAEMAGGAISIASAPGKGTTVEAWVPDQGPYD
jgi:signal transduction histidine kinase